MPTPKPTVSGAPWRATHQHSIDAVLGAGVRTVTSRGSQFVNRDAWTGRAFIAALGACGLVVVLILAGWMIWHERSKSN